MDTPTRRQFLTSAGLATAAGLISAPSLLAQDDQEKKPMKDVRNPWVYHFKIGELDAW